MRNTILVGDAALELRRLPSGFAHCCVTSPPYWGLRDYGVDGQIGVEQTPAEYVARIVGVMTEVHRVLRDDGTLWLNLADTFAHDDKWGGKTRGRTCKGLHDQPLVRTKRSCGLPDKSLVGIPWRVAFALQDAGWCLRQDIIWHKPNAMPTRAADRCTSAHEYLFLLSKRPNYYYDARPLLEPATMRPQRRPVGRKKDAIPRQGDPKQSWSTQSRSNVAHDSPDGLRNKRDVWTIETEPYNGEFFAVFPQALVTPCVLAGTSEAGACSACGAPWTRSQDRRKNNPPFKPSCTCSAGLDRSVVLDPFMGVGTTALVAHQLGRDWVGCELSPKTADKAHERLSPLLAQSRLPVCASLT